MSVLLRHPATVPALFSRAAEPDPPPAEAPGVWRRLARGAPLGIAGAWVAVTLVEVPLVEAAAAAARLAVPH